MRGEEECERGRCGGYKVGGWMGFLWGFGQGGLFGRSGFH